MTLTALRAKLGGGNPDWGRVAVAEGLENGDIYQRGKLYYMVEHSFSTGRKETKGDKLRGSADPKGRTFGELAEDRQTKQKYMLVVGSGMWAGHSFHVEASFCCGLLPMQ